MIFFFFIFFFFFFFNDTATTEIYTLSLHDALPIPTPSSTCRSSGWSASPPAASRSRPVPQAPIQEGTTEMDPTFTEVIRPFLRFAGDQPIEEHTNLREMGLDSMKAIDLLFAIEDEFDI